MPLNFISLKTCFWPPEKSVSIFKATLIWNIPHPELPHAFRITMSCCFFKHYEWNKLTGRSRITFIILVKTFPTLFYSLNLIIFIRNKHAIYRQKHASIALIWWLLMKTKPAFWFINQEFIGCVYVLSLGWDDCPQLPSWKKNYFS